MSAQSSAADSDLTLFLGGDLMTGRGIDQVLGQPSEPDLYERWVQHASDYVTLAERANGPIPRPAADDYIWGDALDVLERCRPAVRLVNLETSITTSAHYQAAKGIHYRMNPANVGCLTAAALDCCVLANNHVLDWGVEGLLETLDVLQSNGIRGAGAGADALAAAAPAMVPLANDARLLVFAYALPSSGVPASWAATEARPGVNWLPDLEARGSDAAETPHAATVAAAVAAHRRPGDRVLVSLHWGGNWGYRISDSHRRLAHALVDEAGADVVHGHSAHHPLALEVYRDRPILYGCGDLLNDYEGIRGYESFRGDLTFMYFPTLDRHSGRLTAFELVPMQMRRFRLNRPSPADRHWMADRLAEQSRSFGVTVERSADADVLTLDWPR